MATMRASVLQAPGHITLQSRPIPEPGPGEVLIKVQAVGVCGSDVHYYEHGRIGDFVVRDPLILGHECSGEVVACGRDTQQLKVGDRVTVEPGIPCNDCALCHAGRYNLCPDVRFLATPPIDGAFCEYIVSPERFAFRLPDEVSYEQGAFVEPLATGVYACRRANVQPGDKVLVLGAGPIGLLAMQAARAYGASETYVVDIVPFRLEMARRLGATATFSPADPDFDGQLRAALETGADVVLEAAGHPKTIEMATAYAKAGGRVALIGMPGEDRVPFHAVEAAVKEVDVLGIFRYAHVFPAALDMIRSGQVEVDALIHRRYNLEQVDEALATASAEKDQVIKVMVQVG